MPAWEALALLRGSILAALQRSYPYLPLADLEDAVSEAALRLVTQDTVTHLRAYWLTAARHALWHQGRARQVAQGRLQQYARECPLEAHGPAKAQEAAHDMAWYLSRLTAKERARLEASVLEGPAAYGSGGRSTTTRVWTHYLRTKLRQARAQEEGR